MRYRVVILGLVIVLAIATIASAAVPSTVAVVTSGVTSRPAALKQVEPTLVNFLVANEVVVVHGSPVTQAVAEMGVQLSVGQEKTDKLDPIQPTVLGKDFLIALGKKLGVEVMVGWHVKAWHRSHLFYRDAKCEISTVAVDVNSGETLFEIVSPAYRTKIQNNEAIAARGAALALGATIAAGGIPHVIPWASRHALAFRTCGWGLGVVSLIPLESRCTVVQASITKGTGEVGGDVVPKLKNRPVTTAQVETLSNQPVAN